MKRVVLLLLAFATACGSSTSPVSIEGTYDLQSIDGAPLPFLLPGSTTSTIQVVSDQITLAGGVVGEHGRWLTHGLGGGSVPFIVGDTGTYTVKGFTATIHLSGGITGTAVGGRATLVEGGLTFQYAKE